MLKEVTDPESVAECECSEIDEASELINMPETEMPAIQIKDNMPNISIEDVNNTVNDPIATANDEFNAIEQNVAIHDTPTPRHSLREKMLLQNDREFY